MESNNHNCLNCGYQLEQGYSFCKNCGQKSQKRLLSLKELIVNAFISIFNLDGPFFKSIFLIFQPWKLTKKYVEGKRISYYHPARLFIILLLIHFGVILSLVNIDNNKTRSNEHFSKLEKSLMLEKYNKLQDTLPLILTQQVTDTLKKHLFSDVKLPENDYLDFSNNFGLKEYKITRKDGIELSKDSIFSKYRITDFSDRILVAQMIKLDLDRAGGIKYMIKNFGWSVIIIVALLASLFKLLYRRKKMYYAEHLVFWMNVHSSSFFIVITTSLLYKITQKDEIQFLALIVFIIPYLSMLLYYEQGWFKTLLKYFLTGIFYTTVCITIALIASLFSLLIF